MKDLRDPLVSIILRTKNEERWVGRCLEKIASQTVKDIDVVLVDNASSDKTVEKAFNTMADIIHVNIDDFVPGLAINEGIRACRGKYLAILSAHCIPASETWLEQLLENFGRDDDAEGLAGVYGRQIPMRFSSALDKRDLMVTFGLDRRVQYKDPFFHNANSLVPRSVWERHPFDEEATNIEDRLWAKQVLGDGMHIVYDPEAAVFHHHGIHQNNDVLRARSVVRIMEDMRDGGEEFDNPMHPEELDTVAIISVRDDPELGRDLVSLLARKTIESAQKARYVREVIVTTDSQELAEICRELGATIPFIRPQELAETPVRADQVVAHALEWMEDNGRVPDLVVPLEITHPFRPAELLDGLICHLLDEGLETVIAGFAEYRPCWIRQHDSFSRIDDFQNRRDERDPLHVGLPSLGCVTLPSILRQGNRIGLRVGIHEVLDPLAAIEVRTLSDIEDAPYLKALFERMETETVA